MCQTCFSLLKHYYLLTRIPRLHRITQVAGVHAGPFYEEVPVFGAVARAWTYMEVHVRRAKTWGSVG